MAEHLTIPGALEWDAVERHSISTLRYAGGKEHDVKYVSEVAYDALVAELKAIKESVEGYESPEHAAQVADELGYQCSTLKQRLDSAESKLQARETLIRRVCEPRYGLMPDVVCLLRSAVEYP